jgi:DNA modification methylase
MFKALYSDPWVDVFNGNCLDILAELPAESVQVCVTSPPYWGLRRYDGQQDYVWGNHSGCEHEWSDQSYVRNDDQTAGSKQRTNAGSIDRDLPIQHHQCLKCQAWKGAYGLEPAPEMYIEHTVKILRAIKRVLKKDGIVWWNIGDSYAGSGKAGNNPDYFGKHTEFGKPSSHIERFGLSGIVPRGLKPKDLCLIPFRVAIAAQQDGWYVRSVVIWSKPNPMPESVKDRPTESHEFILMLTKSSKYYFDTDAVREPARDWGDRDRTKYRAGTEDPLLKHHGLVKGDFASIGRNIRSVWEITTHRYSGAHFATFPEEIPKRCILASTKPTDVVLDPFGGSGTTGKVAKQLGRKAILIDTSAKYCDMQISRIQAVSIPLEIHV